MDTPHSFWMLGFRLHGVRLADCSNGAMADHLVRGLTPAARRDLAEFLDWVLAQPDANLRLKKLWNHSPSDIRVTRSKGMSALFAEVRARL